MKGNNKTQLKGAAIGAATAGTGTALALGSVTAKIGIAGLGTAIGVPILLPVLVAGGLLGAVVAIGIKKKSTKVV